MYASIVSVASFWWRLVEIDKEIQRQTIAKGCPNCAGPLHVANYGRKPRDVPDEVSEVFSLRFSTCCGHCRKRCMPQSVRFLGRRVYAGVVVLLATMHALFTSATKRTLQRWVFWWTQTLPTTQFWSMVQGRLVPAVDTARLPASLLERFENEPAAQTEQGLIKALETMMALTTDTGRSMHFDARQDGADLTQKLRIEENRRGLLPEVRAPTNTT